MGAQQFVVRRLRTSIKRRIRFFEATVASKQPRRSDLTSDLKFMAQTTYATMFVWTDLAVLKLFLHLFRKKEEEENLPPLDLSASPQLKMLSVIRALKQFCGSYYQGSATTTTTYLQRDGPMRYKLSAFHQDLGRYYHKQGCKTTK